MRAELEQKLFQIDEDFYTRDNPRASAMVFGFTCGDGWYGIVSALLEYAKQRKDNPTAIHNEYYDPGNPHVDYQLRWRGPYPCFSEDQSGYEESEKWFIEQNLDPEMTSPRVRKVQDQCAWAGDPLNIRDWVCENGRKIGRDKEDFGQCEMCDGMGEFVWYSHECEQPWNHFEITQVKQKFGALRVYSNTDPDPEWRGAVDLAERLSSRVCEQCGSWEAHNENIRGIYQTLCESCLEEKLSNLR